MPLWGDIPAKGWRIHPRPEAVAFCCRGQTTETFCLRPKISVIGIYFVFGALLSSPSILLLVSWKARIPAGRWIGGMGLDMSGPIFSVFRT
jgi:hypothetical protein